MRAHRGLRSRVLPVNDARDELGDMVDDELGYWNEYSGRAGANMEGSRHHARRLGGCR